MATVSVIYFTGGGHTGKMAEAVHKGVASVPGIKANLIAINGKDIVEGRYNNESVFAQLDASDAIIFGTPTYMGGPAGQFKAFADASAARVVHQRLARQGGIGFLRFQQPQRR